MFAQNMGDLNNRFMLAQSYEQAGEFQKSKDILEDLVKRQPDNYQFFDALNRIYINLKEYDKSAASIQDRLNKNPLDLNLWGMLGSTYHVMGNEQKAFSVWDEALKKVPQNQINYRVMANFAMQRRAFEKAAEYLLAGKKISNDPKIFSYDLGNIYSLTMQYKEAAEEYSDILSSDPNQMRTVESRIMSYINKPGALEPTLKVFGSRADENNISSVYMLARLFIEADDYKKAFDLYLDIDSKQKNQGSELFNFAQAAYSEKHFDMAAQAFNTIIERYPNSPLASNSKLGYAKTLETSLGEEYKAIVPAWKPYYSPVTIPSSKIEGVIEAYNNIINLYPHSEQAYEAYWRLGRMKLSMQNDVTGAEQYFNKIITESPLSIFYPDALLDLAKVEIIKGSIESSEKYYNKVIETKRSPTEQRNQANFNLAKIYFARGDFIKAKSFCGEVTANLKSNTANDAIELSLLMNTQMNDSSKLVIFGEAELLVAGNKFEDALVKYRMVSEDNKSLMAAALAKLRTAEMEIALNKYDEAGLTLGKIADAGSENIYADKALYLLAKIYEYGTKDFKKAAETYEKLLAQFPSSLYLDEARNAIINLRKTS
ncbi:MAG: tetratricopeptide repeat protein [Ignavibacteriaceae bacterium]|nr:tetratricopeptide repeat protein [Ignavibacteriaceae bacterium]